jgi:uncharacterized protein (DUF2235 family)
MPGKRLLLLLDGTWNDPESGASDTNIVRLRNIIARELTSDSFDSPSIAAPNVSTRVQAHEFDGMKHLVFYERGVGTGPSATFARRSIRGWSS